MYSRGKSINPEKQEKLDNMAKQFAAGGKKKWVTKIPLIFPNQRFSRLN